MEVLVNSEERKELISKNSSMVILPDLEEREKLILQNRRLVYYLAKRFDVAPSEYDDVISIGTIGLIKAATTFDKSKKVRFSTYASRCINNEILMYYREKKRYSRDISLDEPINIDDEGDELTLGDKIPGPGSAFVEVLEEKDIFLRTMGIILNLLDSRERFVILHKMSGAKQKYIGKALRISQSYVARLVKKIVEKIEAHLECSEQFEEFYFYSSSIIGDLYQISFEMPDKLCVSSLQNLVANEGWTCKIQYDGKRIRIQIPKEQEYFYYIPQLIEEIENYRISAVCNRDNCFTKEE